jgi:AbrB family looped-hinge helix DNA binding protein
MAETTEVTEVRVGSHGRVVLPAALRKALGVAVGDTLIARREDGRLILEKPETILRRIYALFEGIPGDVSLADELIQERRAEARGEDSE